MFVLNLRVFKKALVWLDQDIECAGAKLETVVPAAMKQCGLLIFILSQTSAESTWQCREIDEFNPANEDGRKRVVPVLHGIESYLCFTE